MPSFTDDDVLDFMVTEAIVAAGQRAEREAAERREKDEEIRRWKKDNDWKRGRMK